MCSLGWHFIFCFLLKGILVVSSSGEGSFANSGTVMAELGKGEIRGANVGMVVDSWHEDLVHVLGLVGFFARLGLHKELFHR